MGKLSIVSTPIGHLKDITLRAIEVLFQADAIACEDTRKTGRLLDHLCRPQTRGGEKKLISYFEGNEQSRIPRIIQFLKEGKNVALVSNAGTPTISDPGFKLVTECIKEGIEVEPIPGPSALLAALVISGLPTDKFFFLGYLPKKPGKRERLLKKLASMNQFIEATLVFYVSPHRLIKELETIQKVLGDLEIVLCRELTKIHEESRRGKISQLLVFFKKVKLKGEFVLVFRISPK